MPARLPFVALWHAAHPPAPLKYVSPAFASPTTTSPTVKIGEPRMVSFTRWRRKFASATISSSVNEALALPLCVWCPAFRNGPSTAPAVVARS